jgi:hypothetical protein
MSADAARESAAGAHVETVISEPHAAGIRLRVPCFVAPAVSAPAARTTPSTAARLLYDATLHREKHLRLAHSNEARLPKPAATQRTRFVPHSCRPAHATPCTHMLAASRGAQPPPDTSAAPHNPRPRRATQP